MTANKPTIGELIATFYSHYFEVYGDAVMASLAAARLVNEVLAEEAAALQ